MTLPATALIRPRFNLAAIIIASLLLVSGIIGIAALYTQQRNIVHGGGEHELAVALAQRMALSIRTAKQAEDNFETKLGTTCNSKFSKRDAATNLVACWQDSVERDLPNGSAHISLDRSTVPIQYVIVVNWSEPRTGAASYVLRVVPGFSAS